MKATSLEAIYRRTIENKKVCFVGACPNIIDKNLGNKIDNYDIVVRTNHFWKPFKNEYLKDYGRRCDILYVNNQYYREMRPLPTTEMKIRGISWLCMKGVKPKDFRRYSKDLFVRTYLNTIKRVCKFVPSASAGSLICEDILQYNPKELYITGIDFFASRKPVFEIDNYQEYIEGYLPRKIQLKGNILNKNKKSDGHDFLGNAKYIYSLFLKNQNFKTDSFIYALLKKIVNKEIQQGEVSWQ
jgi:hypothetical protein